MDLPKTQAEAVAYLEAFLERIKSMTPKEFMSLNEITQPLKTPLG